MAQFGGIGGLLMLRDNSAGLCHFATADADGNVVSLVDAETSSLSARYEYSPYGQTLRASGPAFTLNPIRWSSKFSDEETELVYYGERYYGPSIGRWAARDQSEEAGGINLYSFVANSPAGSIDAFGAFGLVETSSALATANSFENIYNAGVDTTGNILKDILRGVQERKSDEAILLDFFYDTAVQTGIAVGTAALAGIAEEALFGGVAEAGESEARAFRTGNIGHNATEYQALKESLVAKEISAGHALTKHLNEFPGGTTQSDLEDIISRTMKEATEIKHLARGRTAWYDKKTNTLVIRDPSRVDGGTVFRPVKGKAYVDQLN